MICPGSLALNLVQIWDVNIGQKTPSISNWSCWAPQPHTAFLGTREGLLRQELVLLEPCGEILLG